MPGSAYGTTLNFGFGGNVSRTPDCIIAAKAVKSNSVDIPFGTPVILNSDNTISSPKSVTLTAANFLGITVATAQQNNTYPPDNAAGAYEANGIADVLERGVIIVEVSRGTPTAGGAVYVRTALSTEFPAAEIGDFEASADGSQTVQLTNCCWNTGIVDANGMAELKIKSINN